MYPVLVVGLRGKSDGRQPFLGFGGFPFGFIFQATSRGYRASNLSNHTPESVLAKLQRPGSGWKKSAYVGRQSRPAGRGDLFGGPRLAELRVKGDFAGEFAGGEFAGCLEWPGEREALFVGGSWQVFRMVGGRSPWLKSQPMQPS